MTDCPLHPKVTIKQDLEFARAEFWYHLSLWFKACSVFCWGRMLKAGYSPVYHEGTNEVCFFKEVD